MSTDWTAYLLVLTVAYVVPGPDFVLVLNWSTRGRWAGIAASLGVQAGLSVHVIASVFGISVLVARWPEAITVIQLAGALYLVWLGIQTARASVNGASEDNHRNRGAFLQGVGTNLLNPKAIIFVTSLLPQFATGSWPLSGQLALLGAVDVLFGFGIWGILIIVGQRLSPWLQQPAVRKWWQRSNGLALISIGILLAVAHFQ